MKTIHDIECGDYVGTKTRRGKVVAVFDDMVAAEQKDGKRINIQLDAVKTINHEPVVID